MKTISQIGDEGENIAKKILKNIGFRLEYKYLDSNQKGKPSYDFLVVRHGQKYAINVKFGNQFIINPRNLERLGEVYEKYGYKPTHMFIINENFFWFYSLDSQFPRKISIIDHKMEVFS